MGCDSRLLQTPLSQLKARRQDIWSGIESIQCNERNPMRPPTYEEQSYRGKIDQLQAENAKLRAALKPFGRNVRAVSLSEALGHITREDLERARELSDRG